MLIDLIAAHADDAQAILRTAGHANIWPTLEAPGLGPVALSKLAFILSGQRLVAGPLSELAAKFTKLASDGDEGPWIHQLPEQLVIALAQLEAAQMDTVAQAWAGSDDELNHRWGAAGLAGLLAELAALAGSAAAQGQALLLWACP
jgi:hypothetical protein